MSVSTKTIIYLDLNVFSDLTSISESIEPNVKLIATLMLLQHKFSAVIVYSDTHLQELSLTGNKSSLSEHEKSELIQKDLRFIKRLTNSKRLSKNSLDGNYYLNDRCPIKQYEQLNAIIPIGDLLKTLDLLNDPEQVNYSRKLLGLGPKILNNFRTSEGAQEKINSAIKYFSSAIKNIPETDKNKLASLDKKIKENLSENIIHTKNLMSSKLKELLKDPNLDSKIKENLEKAIADFEDQMNAAAKMRNTAVNINTNLPFDIKTTTNKILKETNLSIDTDNMDKTLRNFWGFESKNLKHGISSDYFDIQHSGFIDGCTYFVTNEAENFRKRFPSKNSNIYNKVEFLQYLKSKHAIDINIEIKLS